MLCIALILDAVTQILWGLKIIAALRLQRKKLLLGAYIQWVLSCSQMGIPFLLEHNHSAQHDQYHYCSGPCRMRSRKPALPHPDTCQEGSLLELNSLRKGHTCLPLHACT